MQTDAHNDDDWEYEYDDNETEDFYVTLDLTTYAPPNIPRKRKPESQDPSGPPAQASVDPSLAATNPAPSSTATPSQPLASPPQTDDIQLLDMHTDNPIVSYQGNLYICAWASALGTDLLFSAKPPPPSTTTPTVPADTASTPTHPATPPPPLLQQHPYTLHAMTPLRLLAKPATATPHPPQRPPTARAPAPAASAPLDHRTSAHIAPHRRAQTAFLARLAAAKRARGDSDAVPVYTNEPNHQPPPVPAMVGGETQRRGRRRGAYRGRGRGVAARKKRGSLRRRDEDEDEDENDDEILENDDEEEERSMADGAAADQEEQNGNDAGGKWGRSNRLRRKRRWSKRFEEAMRQEAAGLSDDADADAGAGEDNGRSDDEYEHAEAPVDEDVEDSDMQDGPSSAGAGGTTGANGAA